MRCCTACCYKNVSATGRVALSALANYVAVCVRVHWYCHQSDGTDVMDFPDVLLPENVCLDIFDLESDHSGDLSNEKLVEVS